MPELTNISSHCHLEIKAILDVVECMSRPDYSEGFVEGSIENTPGNVARTKALESIDEEKYFIGELNSPNVTILLPKRQSCFFAKDLSDLFSINWTKEAPPECLYLLDKKAFFPTDDNSKYDEKIYQYFGVTGLISSLKKLADHHHSKGSTTSLVFLHGEKLEIDIDYELEDLVSLNKAKDFENSISDDLHTEQRKSILKKLLIDELAKVDAKDRFKRLLFRFDEIYARYLENYNLYVSDFSIETVMDEMHDKKIKFIGKFSETLSDIQNQLLTIPIAVVLIASQLEKTGLSIKNIAVLFSGLIFFYFMKILIFNQRSVLESLNTELEYTKSQFVRKYDSSIVERLNKTFNDLNSRYDTQKKLLNVVSNSIYGILILLIVLFSIQSEMFDFNDMVSAISFNYLVWETKLCNPFFISFL